jgi:hypothetical protein
MEDLEAVERFHRGIQGTGRHPTIPGDGQTWRIPRSPVLTVVLAIRVTD